MVQQIMSMEEDHRSSKLFLVFTKTVAPQEFHVLAGFFDSIRYYCKI